MSESVWRAIHVHMGSEKKVCSEFKALNMLFYCPVSRCRKYTLGYKKNIARGWLIPGCIFVFCKDELLDKIRQVKDVYDCYYWLGRPVMVTAHEIKLLQEAETFDGCYQIIKLSAFESSNINKRTRNLDNNDNHSPTDDHLSKPDEVVIASLGIRLRPLELQNLKHSQGADIFYEKYYHWL